MDPATDVKVYGQRLERYPPQVRLLTIEPAPFGDDDPIKLTAYRFKLDTAPKYVALSYVWGNPAVTREVTFNGIVVNVTVNLFAALRALRRRNDFWFIWADALCINQDDIVEKNTQLPLMGHIYSRASIVVSWLGESTVNISNAFAFIHNWVKTDGVVRVGSDDIGRLADTISTMHTPFNLLGWSAVHDLLERPYWRRLWIVQEFYATTSIILCGDLELSGVDLLQAVRIWSSIISTEFETSSLTTAAEKALVRSCNMDFFSRTVQERARPLTYKTPYADRPSDISRLVEAMFATSNFETTDPRDKVFALVAFLELSELPLRQDYSMTPPQLYKDLMLYALEDGGVSNLTMIAYAGTGHSPRNSSILPSWVPDFQGNHPYLQEYSRVDKAMLTYWRTPTPWLLKTRGTIVDEIVDISNTDTNDTRRLWKWALFAASVRGDRIESGGIPWRVALYRTLTRSTFEDVESYFKHFINSYFTGFVRAMRQAFIKYEMTSWFTDHPHQDERDGGRQQYENAPSSTLAIEKEALFWSRDPRLIMEEEFGGYSEWHDETLWDQQYIKHDDHHFWERFNSPITTKRVFFVTKTGYMGLAPLGSRRGDQVAVLLGCRSPLIVRKQQDSYELVGDAYVCGLNEGQIMEEIRARTMMLEDILFQ